MRYITIALGWLLAGIICSALGYSVPQILTVSFYVLIMTSESLSDVLYGNIQRAGHLEIAGYSMMAKGIVIVLLFTLGILKFRSLNAALACSAFGTLLFSLVVDLHFHRKNTPSGEAHSLRYAFGILKDCFPLFITSLITALITHFPRVVLERCYGAETLGYYGNISTPFQLVSTIMPTLLIAFLPKYGHAVYKNDFREMYRIWLKTVLGTILIIGSYGIGIFLFGRPIMRFVYTEQILPYVHYLYNLLPAMLLYGLSMCCNTFLIPLRKNWGIMITALISLLVCLLSSTPMIQRLGINGVILVLTLSYGVQVIIQMIWITMICYSQKQKV